MIDIKTLNGDEDTGRKVVYREKGIAPQEGIITSWNKSFIFVDYLNVGWGQATPPDKLEFLTDK